MMPLPLARIAQWAGGRLVGEDVLIDAVATDTRTLDASDGRAALFIGRLRKIRATASMFVHACSMSAKSRPSFILSHTRKQRAGGRAK